MQTWYKILIEKGTLYGLYFSSFYLMSKPNQFTCPFGLHFGFMHLGLAFYLFIYLLESFGLHFGFMRLRLALFFFFFFKFKFKFVQNFQMY